MKGFRSVSIPERLIKQVETIIDQLGTYSTKAEFIREAIRLRMETLGRHRPRKRREKT